MATKTYRITDMIDKVNQRNQFSTCSSEIRLGWNCMLADILHDNNVYAGFRYLYEYDVPQGQKPGIIFDANGPGQHLFPDESRKFFHYSHKLRK